MIVETGPFHTAKTGGVPEMKEVRKHMVVRAILQMVKPMVVR